MSHCLESIKIDYSEGRHQVGHGGLQPLRHHAHPLTLTSRQHLFRMGNTSGVSTNRLDNTRAAESFHDQRISSGARIRHRRRA
jgi:hypothetical protein